MCCASESIDESSLGVLARGSGMVGSAVVLGMCSALGVSGWMGAGGTGGTTSGSADGTADDGAWACPF